MTTVTWTQDVNGNYEVSSPEHLKQIMNQGTLYTDAGSFPTDYWNANYIQTADVDLLSESTDIEPIGNNSIRFTGEYDGGEYAISNWSYIDTSNVEDHVGLFGYTETGVLKNMRLSGVYHLQGFTQFGGFLVGYARANIFNIVCDFDVGTSITRAGGVTSFVNFGCLIGRTQGSTSNRLVLTGVDLNGNIDLSIDENIEPAYVAGIVGAMIDTDASLMRITATISGLVGTSTGGVTAVLNASSITNSINAMTGNISGSTTFAGGIIGSGHNSHSLNNVVNSMTGDIVSSTGSSGGILGRSLSTGTYESCFNYMAGDISGNNAGGIVGIADSTSTVPNSINAMNGNVENSVRGSGTISGSVAVNTNFGLTFTSNTSGTSTALTGFLTLAEFPDLPYFLISGSDTIGNSYEYDFVFANLGGNNSFSTTHLIISGSVGTFQDGVVPVIPPLSLVPRPINILVKIGDVLGALGYNVTIEGPAGGEITVLSGVTTLEHTITGLVPETAYTIKLYVDTGSGYILQEELATMTSTNIAANYDINDFVEDGVVNLSSLPEVTISSINAVMNELFTTGDLVNVYISDKLASFINLGDTLSIEAIDGVLLPFGEASGSGQGVSVVLSDTTTVGIDYDDTVNTITVNGVVYFPGDTFILDGKKVRMIDY